MLVVLPFFVHFGARLEQGIGCVVFWQAGSRASVTLCRLKVFGTNTIQGRTQARCPTQVIRWLKSVRSQMVSWASIICKILIRLQCIAAAPGRPM